MNNEPVAELVLEQMAVGDARSLRVNWFTDSFPPAGTKLYTHPAKTLTDEEIISIADDYEVAEYRVCDFARAILKKASEK
jgi:hypothetical protein